METAQQKIERARARRETGLAKVEPKLAGLPDQLPRNSLDLSSSILTAREIELTEKYDVIELLRILKSREVSVEEVTRAFLRRAAVAHAAASLILSPSPALAPANTGVDELSGGVDVGSGHYPGQAPRRAP